jgi:hypothetical protein
MDVKSTNVTVTLTFTKEELRVIGLALAGRLKERDVAMARALNDKLLETRQKILRDELDALEGAIEQVKNASHPE